MIVLLFQALLIGLVASADSFRASGCEQSVSGSPTLTSFLGQIISLGSADQEIEDLRGILIAYSSGENPSDAPSGMALRDVVRRQAFLRLLLKGRLGPQMGFRLFFTPQQSLVDRLLHWLSFRVVMTQNHNLLSRFVDWLQRWSR